LNTANASPSPRGKVIGKKAWPAYLAAVIASLLFMLVALFFFFVERWSLGVITFSFAIAFGVLRFYSLKSYQIVVNKEGVWIFSGIFPWTKGYTGVKWGDLDEALFYQSFMGWLTKSYTVLLTHRFTKTTEIKMSETERGDEVVSLINKVQSEILKTDTPKRV
jgi:hypothetical protein